VVSTGHETEELKAHGALGWSGRRYLVAESDVIAGDALVKACEVMRPKGVSIKAPRFVLALEKVFNLLIVQPMKDGGIKEPARLGGWHGREIREGISLHGRIRSRDWRQVELRRWIQTKGSVHTKRSTGVGRIGMRRRQIMKLRGRSPAVANHGSMDQERTRIAGKLAVSVW
jgi:hypothetical protein